MTQPTLNPKLPPKWKWKQVESLLCDLPRCYVAAIVEIEWRKRAAEICEKQDVIFSRLWEHHNKKPRGKTWRKKQEARYQLLRDAENECYDIAKAWREWGKE